MFTREKVLLALLDRAGGGMSRTRLVKLAFFFAQENPDYPAGAVYQFVPYRFGPFSFTLYHELERLAQAGAVSVASGRLLRPGGNAGGRAWTLEARVSEAVDRVYRRYGGLSTPSLIEAAYTQYPWYMLKSDRIEKRAVRPQAGERKVYTAGYEGRQVDGFLALLLRHGIEVLLDVRANPVSRRYGFHRNTLARICRRLGLEYRHLPEVGVPSEWRVDLGTDGSHSALFRRYEREILPAREDVIRQIARSMQDKPAVLVCYEADVRLCHRSRLARAVSLMSGLEICDLG